MWDTPGVSQLRPQISCEKHVVHRHTVLRVEALYSDVNHTWLTVILIVEAMRPLILLEPVTLRFCVFYLLSSQSYSLFALLRRSCEVRPISLCGES